MCAHVTEINLSSFLSTEWRHQRSGNAKLYIHYCPSIVRSTVGSLYMKQYQLGLVLLEEGLFKRRACHGQYEGWSTTIYHMPVI